MSKMPATLNVFVVTMNGMIAVMENDSVMLVAMSTVISLGCSYYTMELIKYLVTYIYNML